VSQPSSSSKARAPASRRAVAQHSSAGPPPLDVNAVSQRRLTPCCVASARPPQRLPSQAQVASPSLPCASPSPLRDSLRINSIRFVLVPRSASSSASSALPPTVPSSTPSFPRPPPRTQDPHAPYAPPPSPRPPSPKPVLHLTPPLSSMSIGSPSTRARYTLNH
jgi:hypothetical protein